MWLLEDLIEGKTVNFIEEHREWWSCWFKEIRKWEPKDIDTDRLSWIKYSGIPYHAWSTVFFEIISSMLGTFINCDYNTFTKLNMNMARVRILTSCMAVINETIPVKINGY